MKGIMAAYIEGVHPSGFGYCRRAEVIGVRIIETSVGERECFHVRYENGEEDFIALKNIDDGTYVFVHKDGTKLTR